jgi:hypothetical protein
MLIVFPPCKRPGSHVDRPNPSKNPRKTCFVHIPRSVVHRTSQKPLLFQAFLGGQQPLRSISRFYVSPPPSRQTTRHQIAISAHLRTCRYPSANNSASVQPMPKSQTQSSQSLSAIQPRHYAPTFCALSTLVRKANPAPHALFRPSQELTPPLPFACISVHLRLTRSVRDPRAMGFLIISKRPLPDLLNSRPAAHRSESQVVAQ